MQFPPNLNIFKGADFYYDQDTRSFGPLPHAAVDGAKGDEDESDSSAPDSSPAGSPRTRSLPDQESAVNEYREMSSASERSFNSCPADFLGGADELDTSFGVDSEQEHDDDANDGSP